MVIDKQLPVLKNTLMIILSDIENSEGMGLLLDIREV